MSPVVVSEFVTLDGVMQMPEQWVFGYHDEHSLRFKTDEISDVDALLLGRRTYDIFAASWPSMTGEMADRMNSIRKYVVTRGATDELTWHNSQAIHNDVVEAVTTLRQRPGRGILVVGSGRLVAALADNALIDEYRLFVCPIALGQGQRLFDVPNPCALTLTDRQEFATGAVLLRYTATIEARRAS